MAITYPLTLPTLPRTVTALVLQSPDLTKWDIKVDNNGILSAVGGASGSAATFKMRAPDGGIWERTIDNNGITQFASSSGNAVDNKLFQSADGRQWLWVIDNDGIDTVFGGANLPNHVFGHVRYSPLAAVGMHISPFTYHQQIQKHQGQLWAAELNLIPLGEALGEEWIATLLALNGPEGTFLWGDPTRQLPRGTVLGSPIVSGGNQSGQSLVTKGWTINSTDLLKRGDMIQLGAGVTQRMHRVLNPVNSDGSGNSTIDIWPRLREEPDDGERIVYRYTSATFRLKEGMEWDLDSAARWGMQISIMEAL